MPLQVLSSLGAVSVLHHGHSCPRHNGWHVSSPENPPKQMDNQNTEADYAAASNLKSFLSVKKLNSMLLNIPVFSWWAFYEE